MAGRTGTWMALAARRSTRGGMELAGLRQAWLRRRVAVRMLARQLRSCEEYVRLLGADPREIYVPAGGHVREEVRGAGAAQPWHWLELLPVAAVVAEAGPGGRRPRLVAANHLARVFLGNARAAFTASSSRWQWLQLDHRPCRDEDLPLCQAVRRGRATVGRELMLRDAEGRLRLLAVDAARLPGRRPACAIETVRAFPQRVLHDVTTQEAAGCLRAEAVDLATHDLRSPLATIAMGVEAAERSLARQDPAGARRVLQMVAAATRRLERLADSLLDTSRLEAAQPVLRLAEVRPDEVLAAAAAEVELALATRKVRLELELADPLPGIAADGDIVFRALVNLLDNAIKYSPPGGQVWLRAAAHDRGILYTVRDQGPGIPPELEPHIFDKCVGQQPPGARRGYGLGLWFCKLAAEAHGGSVWVDTGPGRGSRFNLWLPARPPGHACPEEAPTPP